jgi:adenosylcobinamide-phosphate synthase
MWSFTRSEGLGFKSSALWKAACDGRLKSGCRPSETCVAIDGDSLFRHVRPVIEQQGAILDGGRTVVLLVALVAEFLIGCFPGVARFASTPFRIFATLFSWLESKLNRTQRSSVVRWIRGAALTFFVTALALAAAFALAAGTGVHDSRYIVEGAVVCLLLSGRQVFAEISPIGRALRDQGGDAARRALARVAPYETREFDDHAVARGAIELAAHRFVNGLVAPSLWYLVAGLPGFLVYIGVSHYVEAAASLYRPPQPFGAAPRAVLYVLDIVPAPLAALFLTVAAVFVPAANPTRAARTMLADSRHYGAYGAGWTIAATAGALGLALAGPRRFGAIVASTPWIGQGRARAEALDVRRAIYLVAIAWLLFAAALGIVALAAVEH